MNIIHNFAKKNKIILPRSYIDFIVQLKSSNQAFSRSSFFEMDQKRYNIEYFLPFDIDKKFGFNPFQWKVDHDYIPRFLWPIAMTEDATNGDPAYCYLELNGISQERVFLNTINSKINKQYTIQNVLTDKGILIVASTFADFLNMLK
jgi:hypothetical protein